MGSKRTIAVVAAIAMGVVGLVSLTAAKGPLDKPSSGRPKGKERDVSGPNEGQDLMVWRNGKFHRVHIRVKQKEITEPNGNVASVIEADPNANVEGQLPPRDPALDRTEPTAEQKAEARKELGIDDVSPPPDVKTP